jgi:Family of unknown function (DUF6502)
VSIAGKQDPRARTRGRVGREHAHAEAKRRLRATNDRLTLFPETPEVLERIARLLVGGGESPEMLSRKFAAACHRVRPRSNVPRRTEAAPLEYAHVISRWYSDPEYLDSAGVPRPLALSGRHLSLTSLIAKALPRAKASEVASTLERLGAVRQENRQYRPTERYVYFGQQREDAVAWLLTVLPGVLSSVEHNAYTRASSRLLGRAAINPYFPVRDLAGFHARLSKHSIGFLKAVDGDMQRKELRRPTGPTTQLGVVVFAFEDPLVTGQAARHKTELSSKGLRRRAREKGTR